MRKPPALIVSALLSGYRDAVEIPCDGNLPLHLALKYGASLDVIQMLALTYPKSLKTKDDNGKSPQVIFEENEHKWKSTEEVEAIHRLLEEGIDSVVFDDAGNADETKSLNMFENGDVVESENSPDMMTTLNDEGWKKVSVFSLCA